VKPSRPQKKAPAPAFDLGAAAAHVASSDERMGELVAKVGALALVPDGVSSTFDALVHSIIYQQLNGRAAGAIHGRVRDLFPGKRVTPRAVLAISDSELRGAGLSRGKVLALRDLAARTIDGTVPRMGDLHAMPDDEIVDRLVSVRGIGRWSVEMLLIFRLGRPDVMAATDYGVRNGFMLTYRKRALPSPADVERQAEKWRPYRTAASWYLWRAVDLAKAHGPAEAKTRLSTKARIAEL
jgi:3-methyladenine DNA glycosylase/8-oxoguanine DNA glycosylase